MNILNKIRSNKGESLIEALVSILVVILSCLTLYFSVITAARLNASAVKADDAFRQETSTAEQKSGGGGGGVVTIKSDKTGDPFSSDIDVVYTGGDGALTSYQLGGEGS